MTPWKNRICSTAMKLRKSLVKPVTRQKSGNITSCSVLPPEIVMQDAFNVILWTSANKCVVHDDLGWKNRTTHYNWMAPWKNRISSTSMKLRKSPIKPVTRQNISICSVLSSEIVMHDAFNVILWTSADICVVAHDDLGWKNRTTRYILPCHWLYEWFSSAANVRRYMHRAWLSRVKKPNNTL